MKSSSQNYGNYKPANQRTLALALLICFISASLLSGAFVLAHAGHVHDHSGIDGTCVTCIQIQTGENILRLLGMAIVGSFIILTKFFISTTVAKAIYTKIAALTPITSKTRMNN